ncbi:hypothetical protein ACFL4H_01975, partial [Candidatus Neomarinimicrobiota bacterium]
IAFCILLLTNCVTITTIPLDGGNYDLSSHNILIFENEEDVKQPYEKLAIITSETREADVVETSKMIDKLLTKANEIGADAIIFREHLIAGGTGILFSDTKSIRVTAIKFKK